MNKHANCQKILAFSVATALLLFMAACSFEKPEPTPLTLDALCGDTGEYQLEEFPWGASYESMEASVTAYETGGSKLDGSKIYMTEQEYELRGQNSSAELIFYHGKLGDVCFHFTLAEGGEEWYAELLKELTALYGETESTERPAAIPGKAGSVEHLWKTDKTGLQLASVTSGEKVSVELKLLSREVAKW